MISKRLALVASFVPQGAVLLDVGSDHAYLPIYLLEQGRIERAIAGEVVQGPYQFACKNVAEHQLSEQVEVRLANGLEALEFKDEVTTITIAGMGGRLIATILENGLSKLEGVERFILQPNNREDELRSWLQENGFLIVNEAILEEAGKFYEILVVEKGQMTLSGKEVTFGPFLHRQSSLVFQKKWQKEKAKLMYALEQIPPHHERERSILNEKMTAIKEVLHESN